MITLVSYTTFYGIGQGLLENEELELSDKQDSEWTSGFVFLCLLHCSISEVDHSCQRAHLLRIKTGIVSGNYQTSRCREWTSRFGLEGDRQLFLSPLSSRLRFDKAVVGPPTNHWVSAPKTPALNSIISPTLLFLQQYGNN